MEQEKNGLPVLTFASDAEWNDWLAANGEASDGAWLKIAKKGNDSSALTRIESVRTALCWGWIDGLANSLDDDWYVVRYTPRRARSNWSKVNVGYVEELTAEGRMQPAGLEQVEAAKADGRWDAAYSPPSANHVPPELQAELDKSPEAAAAFAALGASKRFTICVRIETAKRAETKLRNAEKFARMLERGEEIR